MHFPPLSRAHVAWHDQELWSFDLQTCTDGIERADAQKRPYLEMAIPELGCFDLQLQHEIKHFDES